MSGAAGPVVGVVGGGGAMHATALAKQNEFLKGYISRLQRQLEDYLGSYLPPPTSTSEREAEQLAPWIGDSASLSPLLEAYDRRIAEADAAYESLSSQQAAIQARVRQLTAENERLMAEVKQLTSMSVAAAEQGQVGLVGGEASSTKVVELEEKVALLTSENEVMVDECKALREDAARQKAQNASVQQQLLESREENNALRKRAASQELEDSQGSASAKIALAEAERKSSLSDRLRMELDAAEREVKVLSDELDKARHDLRLSTQQAAQANKRAEEQAQHHKLEREKLEREQTAAKDHLQSNSGALVKLKYELEEAKSRADDFKKESERLKRQLDETVKNERTIEQQLVESRAREETLKETMRRLEEEKDELQLSADQASALKEQAQREIARLSDRLQQVLVEAQARSEETVASIRSKYQAQKSRLQQQIVDLELEVSTLQNDKERLKRECKSAEEEADKLAKEGPGGNLGRLQREIDALTQQCKDISVERDQAVHGAKASELAVRRKEAQWEQSQLQAAAQVEALQRKLRDAQAETAEAKDELYKAQAAVELASRREEELGADAKAREREAQERFQRHTDTCKAQLEEMLERVKRAEDSEEASKTELSQLLAAHDKLQDKWREASREMAQQSQRHITDLKEEVSRLENRNRELSDKVSDVLGSSASTAAKAQQQDRALERLRMLHDAAEKRAEEAKQQMAELLRTEAELRQQRKQDAFQLERQELELQRLGSALQDARAALDKTHKKDELALCSQAELEAALREAKLRALRLKQRLAVMGGGNGQGGAGADGDLDEALAHVGSGDKASSVVGSWRDSATPTSSEDV